MQTFQYSGPISCLKTNPSAHNKPHAWFSHQKFLCGMHWNSFLKKDLQEENALGSAVCFYRKVKKKKPWLTRISTLKISFLSRRDTARLEDVKFHQTSVTSHHWPCHSSLECYKTVLIFLLELHQELH